MNNNEMLTIPFLAGESFRKHGKNNAMGFVGEDVITYHQLKERTRSVMRLLEDLRITPGDKVAILSTSMPNWGAAYLAITSMGAVAVPILPDFTPGEIANVLNHSEAKALFLSGNLAHKVAEFKPEALETVIAIDDFRITSGNDQVLFVAGSEPSGKYNVAEEDLAVIIYTSGTTGKSKGVMLTHRNICFTARQVMTIQYVVESDVFLSILPLSHTYEQTLGLILPLFNGAMIWYLRKAPTPSVLLPALQQVRPTTMLTVPLIMEKVYFNKVAPTFHKNKVVAFLYGTPLFRRLLNRIAGKKIYEAFGGRLRFFGVGGAKLNPTVEQFLLDARFPYAIGYGLTETSPLLAGTKVGSCRHGSTGPAMQGVTLRIKNPDPVTGEGEIWARGENVMKGYYREPAMTAEVLTPDGWFRTGDLGVVDKHGYLSIRGRLKNMIVGSSGENIYPEEIESVINDFGHVIESLVVQKKGKLVAMVHLNIQELQAKYAQMKKDFADQAELIINEYLEELQRYVNSRVNRYSQLQLVVYQPEPFQKTATLKIKRFLYY
ncbi:MAG: AMP-binding protein [Bacteroidales bacterium]|nr:AMP-binding protein [Bacteroidales bacterium]HOC47189.1 AMP-binding protein [Bacteroidales bacterium]HPS97003.1 AMP-binding protein [Bacteroidales bacterium]